LHFGIYQLPLAICSTRKTMTPRIEAGDPTHRGVSQGRSFAYVIPCASEDILKIGFSRDPLTRPQTLHPRYFEFFDLDASMLIEADKVRDVRSIERELGGRLEEHRAPAPLVVNTAAGGHTEWYRGALSSTTQFAIAVARERGFRLHRPLRQWLRDELDLRSDVLFEWTHHVYEQLVGANLLGDATVPAAQTLRDALDAYTFMDLALTHRVTADVLDWHRMARR
jgi:T5orf172 domain